MMKVSIEFSTIFHCDWATLKMHLYLKCLSHRGSPRRKKEWRKVRKKKENKKRKKNGRFIRYNHHFNLIHLNHSIAITFCVLLFSLLFSVLHSIFHFKPVNVAKDHKNDASRKAKLLYAIANIKRHLFD